MDYTILFYQYLYPDFGHCIGPYVIVQPYCKWLYTGVYGGQGASCLQIMLKCFRKKTCTCMSCVWREKEVESKCSNMLTFPDNLVNARNSPAIPATFCKSKMIPKTMFIKIPFWRKVKRNPFSISSLALNIRDFVLSFFHINLLSSTWDNEPPEGRSWVLHGSRTPGTCQNPLVRAEDKDEAKCYDWITYNTGDWKGHSTVLIPQPWTLHLFRTHTHNLNIFHIKWEPPWEQWLILLCGFNSPLV